MTDSDFLDGALDLLPARIRRAAAKTIHLDPTEDIAPFRRAVRRRADFHVLLMLRGCAWSDTRGRLIEDTMGTFVPGLTRDDPLRIARAIRRTLERQAARS